MERTFRAKKMIERVKKEGLGHMLDKETLDFINLLDGEVGNDYNYASFVHDKPVVWIEANDKHEGVYVNLSDCD